MVTTTFTELRSNAKKVFDAVENGETVEIYRNGRPIALLMPYRGGKHRWLDVKPLEIPGVSLSKFILSDRDSE